MRLMKESGIEWIGTIPSNRMLIRNKYMLKYVKGRLPSDVNKEGNGFPYIGASDIDDDSGLFENYTEDSSLPNAERDDLLVLWDGARAGIAGTNKEGKLSSTVVKILPNETVYKPFLYWYYIGFKKYMCDMVNGTTIPHMSRKYVEDIGFIDWPFDEQKRLADYLDSKCSKIDSIIAKQETIIEKLKEYKLSVITKAVTKGLDPNVEMKDSGIEWIDKIPINWEIHKLCWDYSTMLGKMLDSKRIVGNHLHPYIKNSDVQWFEINFINLSEMDFDDDEIERYSICPGDLMVCEGGEIGKCAIVPDDAPQGIYYQKALHRIRKRKNAIGNSRFLSYVLFCMAHNQCFDTSPGKATIAHLPGDALDQLRIPSPSGEEQIQIADYLDNKCLSINSMICSHNTTKELLLMFKKSLVYEVVTGKMEVPTL